MTEKENNESGWKIVDNEKFQDACNTDKKSTLKCSDWTGNVIAEKDGVLITDKDATIIDLNTQVIHNLDDQLFTPETLEEFFKQPFEVLKDKMIPVFYSDLEEGSLMKSWADMWAKKCYAIYQYPKTITPEHIFVMICYKEKILIMLLIDPQEGKFGIEYKCRDIFTYQQSFHPKYNVTVDEVIEIQRKTKKFAEEVLIPYISKHKEYMSSLVEALRTIANDSPLNCSNTIEFQRNPTLRHGSKQIIKITQLPPSESFISNVNDDFDEPITTKDLKKFTHNGGDYICNECGAEGQDILITYNSVECMICGNGENLKGE